MPKKVRASPTPDDRKIRPKKIYSVRHIPDTPEFPEGAVGRRLFCSKNRSCGNSALEQRLRACKKTLKTVSDFETIDVHDDTIEGISFHPAVKRGVKAKVTVELFRRWTNTRRVLTFNDCANVEFVLGSDVLTGNAPNNTSHLEATADIAEIEALVRRHKRSWNVAYEASIDPLGGRSNKLLGEHCFEYDSLAAHWSSRRVRSRSNARQPVSPSRISCSR